MQTITKPTESKLLLKANEILADYQTKKAQREGAYNRIAQINNQVDTLDIKIQERVRGYVPNSPNFELQAIVRELIKQKEDLEKDVNTQQQLHSTQGQGIRESEKRFEEVIGVSIAEFEQAKRITAREGLTYEEYSPELASKLGLTKTSSEEDALLLMRLRGQI